MTEWFTLKVPKATMEKIEEFKRRNGYPSCSQAVTVLAERYTIVEELKKTFKEVVKAVLA